MHTPMTDADVRHLADLNAPLGDSDRAQAAAEIYAQRDQIKELATALSELLVVRPFDLARHLKRQRDFSLKTFGPGVRTKGVVDHIRKELVEIEAAPGDLTEWIDVILLAFDGAWRTGANAEQIVTALVAKQTRNEARTWPDWRTANLDQAIQHDNSGEAADAAR